MERLAVATRIYELIFNFEASYDDVLTIAVHQARSEGASRRPGLVLPLEVLKLTDQDLGLMPGILELDVIEPSAFPDVMTAENPLDALMFQHEILEALEGIHHDALSDLMNDLQSQWPGMSQDLCDQIIGSMLFGGSVSDSLKKAVAAYYIDQYGKEA